MPSTLTRRERSRRADVAATTALDVVLRHCHNVAYAESGIIDDVTSESAEVAEVIVASIISAWDRARSSPREVAAKIVAMATSAAERVLVHDLVTVHLVTRRCIGSTLSTMTRGLLREAGDGDREVVFAPPSRAEAEVIVSNLTKKGAWASQVSNLKKKMTPRVRDLLTSGLERGLAPREIASSISKVVGDKRAWRSIVRTEVQRVNNMASQDLYARNSDMLGGQQFLATLDSRTCPVCQAYDGRTWWYVPAEGQDAIADRPEVPVHQLCRCTYVPVLRGAGELSAITGMPTDQFPFATGKPPKRTTYAEWIGGQSAATQLAILGKRKLALLQQGVPVTAFSAEGRSLTTKQLERLAPGEVAAVKPVKAVRGTKPKDPAPGQPVMTTAGPPLAMTSGGVTGVGGAADAVAMMAAKGKVKKSPKTTITAPTASVSKRPGTMSEIQVSLQKSMGAASVKVEELTDVIQNVTTHMEGVSKRVPGFIKLVKRQGVTVKFVHADRVNERAAGLYSHRTRTVLVGARYKTSEAQLSLGKFNVDSSASGIVRHELSHAAYDSVSDEFRASWVRLYVAHSKKEWGKAVSKYGATSASELWAESVSAWTHPGYGSGKKRLPKVVESVMEKFFKKTS